MQLRPMKPYILIRIARQHQQQKKGKIGSILIPETQRFFMYNMQAGEILAIGDKAAEYFPEMKVGQTALIHHFCEAENEDQAREDHLVHQDDDYNYYVVTCFEFYRKGNETYGVWDGEKIIPNKEYIFLEPPLKDDPKSPDEYINSALSKTQSGLLVFSNWTESRETKTEKMQRLKKEIESLSKSGISQPHIKKGIEEKESELTRMSLDVNSKKYEAYTIAAFNPELKEHFHPDANIAVGEIIYVLNIAAQTEIDFNGRKYVVAKANYIAATNKAPAL